MANARSAFSAVRSWRRAGVPTKARAASAWAAQASARAGSGAGSAGAAYRGQPQPEPQHQVLLAAEALQGRVQAGLRPGVIALAHPDGGGRPHRLGPQRVGAAVDQRGQFVGVHPRLRHLPGLRLHRHQRQQRGGPVLHAQLLAQGEPVGGDGRVQGGGDLTERAQAAGQPGQAAHPQLGRAHLVAERDQPVEVGALGGVVALQPGGPGQQPQRLPAQHRALVALGGQRRAQRPDGVRGTGGGRQRQRVRQGTGHRLLEVGDVQAQPARQIAHGPVGGLARPRFQAGEIAGGHALA
nr:hypothetical protein [Streptomyces sp. S1D4-11]